MYPERGPESAAQTPFGAAFCGLWTSGSSLSAFPRDEETNVPEKCAPPVLFTAGRVVFETERMRLPVTASWRATVALLAGVTNWRLGQRLSGDRCPPWDLAAELSISIYRCANGHALRAWRYRHCLAMRHPELILAVSGDRQEPAQRMAMRSGSRAVARARRLAQRPASGRSPQAAIRQLRGTLVA